MQKAELMRRAASQVFVDRVRTAGKEPAKDAGDIDTLASNIAAISKAMNRLLGSGLNRKAVLVLLSHETKLSQNTIRTVLDGLQDLARKYT